MGSASGMIAEARKSLGMGESPANTNAITRWYGMNGQPWCDMSVTYWAHKSGNAAAVCPNGPHTSNNHYAYTVWHAQRFKDLGQWHTGVAGIRAGDVIFYDWSGSRSIGAIDHVGIVEYVSGGSIHTIEGNRGDRCGRFIASPSVVVGYGRPKYSGGGTEGSADNAVSKDEDDMANRVNVGWYGTYKVPADGKYHTLAFDHVYQDDGKQRAKNGQKSSTIVSSAAGFDAQVHLKFSDLTAGRTVQVRAVSVDPKTGKVKNGQDWVIERSGTGGDSYIDAEYIAKRNEKGRKIYMQVKNQSGKPATLKSAYVSAKLVKD